jgi:hypothetical protein
MDHAATYARNVDQVGTHYANCVRRFQDGFLEGPRPLCKDPDAAFKRAVETCERLLPVIRARAPFHK